MVKSYQGARAVAPREEQQIQVKDYMTRKLETFYPEQSMDEAITILLAKRISGGPVVDKENNLIGIISEGDCLKEVVRGKYNNSPQRSGQVRDHMTTDVQTILPTLNIFEVAQLFLNRRIRRFPVMEHGKLLGQISQRDVMRAVQSLKEETWR
ncbi:MAG: CBS domain-containing protein [Owenweeksia sp.]|nr:CBS domain-containing protein [Owenweeksia sp.]